MHVGNPSNATQSTLKPVERVNSNGDAAEDPVRNAYEAVDFTLARWTSAILAADAPVKNGGVVTRPTFIAHEQENDSLAKIMNLPLLQPRRTPAATLHALQEWEGYVLEIGDTDFTARLVDLTADASHEEEEAIIPLVEISDDDAKKVRVGSIFRWVIGYERSATRTKKRVSQFVFRDLPAITKSDLRDGEAWANEIVRSFDL